MATKKKSPKKPAKKKTKTTARAAAAKETSPPAVVPPQPTGPAGGDDLPEDVVKARARAFDLPTAEDDKERKKRMAKIRKMEGADKMLEVLASGEPERVRPLIEPWTRMLDGMLTIAGDEFRLTDNEKEMHTQVWCNWLIMEDPEDIDPNKMMLFTFCMMYGSIIARRAPRGYVKLSDYMKKKKAEEAEKKRKAGEERKKKKTKKKGEGQ